jgi:hypothetical protein
VDFFDRLQYGFTEFYNEARIKLLLLKIMAEALSAVVNYIKAMRIS